MILESRSLSSVLRRLEIRRKSFFGREVVKAALSKLPRMGNRRDLFFIVRERNVGLWRKRPLSRVGSVAFAELMRSCSEAELVFTTLVLG